MTVRKKTKSELLLLDKRAPVIELSATTEDGGVRVHVHDPVGDDYADMSLSWEDAETLKRWLGRRLRERAGR